MNNQSQNTKKSQEIKDSRERLEKKGNNNN